MQSITSNKSSSKKLMVVLTFLGLYLLATGTSWAVFTYLNKGSGAGFGLEGIEGIRSKIADLPKTEDCVINGAKFTKPEREIWETRRPVTVIVENHVDSRPIEGIHKADVVYEAVAEGGITRFLAVFYCGASAEDSRVAPVRSARIYFVNWAAEYGEKPIFVHVGGANNYCKDCPGGVKYAGQVAKEVRAVEELFDLGWRVRRGNDFDTHWDIGFPVLYRDPERLGHPIATEHTMVSTLDSLFAEAQERGFGYKDPEGVVWSDSFTPWKFTEEAPLSSPKTDNISFEFWSNQSDYDVRWQYDRGTNSYLRFNKEQKQVDLKSGEQFTAKNVVIQFVTERGPVDKEKHMYYETTDEGDAVIFQNGDAIVATWEKKSQTGRTKFHDKSGKEIAFVGGVIWIETVPVGNEIEY